jgi:hypothetical protein
MYYQYGNGWLCAACDFEFGPGLTSGQQLQLQAWPIVEIQGKASEHVCMCLRHFLQKSSEVMNTLDMALEITM